MANEGHELLCHLCASTEVNDAVLHVQSSMPVALCLGQSLWRAALL